MKTRPVADRPLGRQGNLEPPAVATSDFLHQVTQKSSDNSVPGQSTLEDEVSAIDAIEAIPDDQRIPSRIGRHLGPAAEIADPAVVAGHLELRA